MMLLPNYQRRYSRPWKQRVIALCLSIFTFLAVVLPQLQAISETPQKGAIDWVVVIDTSASMRGAGGTKDIFPQVKSTVLDFVNQASVGDSVTIFTFDRDTTLRSNIVIESNADRGNLKQIVNNLEAEGQRTHTGKAVQEALQYTAQINQRPDADERTLSVLFFTDGLEDVRGIPNPVPIPANIQLIQEQNCKPYLFFISLGEQEHEEQLEEFANHPALCNRGQVIRDPGAENLLQEGEKIRQTIQPPPPPPPTPAPPPPPEVSLTTDTPLDFGAVSPGEATTTQTLTITSNVATPASLELLDNNGNGEISLVSPQEPINLAPGENTISVQLRVNPDSDSGQRDITFVLRPATNEVAPVNSSATLAVKTPLSQKLLWLLLLVLILVGLIMLVVWWLKSPGHLVGALKLISPQPANSEDTPLDLTRRKRSQFKLSELFPDLSDQMQESDAILKMVRQDSRKYPIVQAIKGTVSVNGIEIVNEEIYDGDKITVGKVTVEFNSVAYSRPTVVSEYDEII